MPTAGEVAAFEDMVSLVLQGEDNQAGASATQPGYELGAYTDTVSENLFYVLNEVNPIPWPGKEGVL